MHSSSSRLDIVLNRCLDSIQKGNLNIDKLLNRFPELKSTLKPSLEAATWLYVNRFLFDPEPHFVVFSRYHLAHITKRDAGIIFNLLLSS